MSDLISRADAIDAVRKAISEEWLLREAIVTDIEALPSADAVNTDLVQRSDVLEVISDAQDGSGSTYNILQPIFVKVNNLPSCHRCYECDEQYAVSRKYTVTLNSPISIQPPMVAVVRCKDCRHYAKGHCYMYGGQMNDDDYCSYGERAEQTEYKLPGHDEVMEALDKMTLRGDKDD